MGFASQPPFIRRKGKFQKLFRFWFAAFFSFAPFYWKPGPLPRCRFRRRGSIRFRRLRANTACPARPAMRPGPCSARLGKRLKITATNWGMSATRPSISTRRIGRSLSASRRSGIAKAPTSSPWTARLPARRPKRRSQRTVSIGAAWIFTPAARWRKIFRFMSYLLRTVLAHSISRRCLRASIICWARLAQH